MDLDYNMNRGLINKLKTSLIYMQINRFKIILLGSNIEYQSLF